MDNHYVNRLTLLTLRWVYGENRENEFFRCTSPSEVKNFFWKYMKSHFDKDEKKFSGWNSDKSERYETVPASICLEQFIKGTEFISFEGLYGYIVDRKKPHIQKIVNVLAGKKIVQEKKDTFIKELEEYNKNIKVKEEQKWIKA